MSDASIQVSSISPHIVRVGHERTPVIIIDDFADDLSELLAFVRQQPFTQDAKSYYPGVRAAISKPYAIAVIDQVFQLIYDVYQIPTHRCLKPHTLAFSLISSPPTSLQPLQCLPHFDTSSPYYFAILHYLNDGPHGNTAFFRHRPTGFERINDERAPSYFASAQQYIDKEKLATQQYFVKSDDHFEIIDQIEYRPNRLAIYPGNILHSTLVNPETDIDSNPATGRLTANLFINFI